jgi:hypothetical protein
MTFWVLQDRIPEAIPSQKWYMNMGPILNCYGIIIILNVSCVDMFIGKTKLR